MMFSHTIQEGGKAAVIKATCPLDTRSAGDFKTLVEYLMSSRVFSLVIDGSTLDFISSEGLFTLYSINRKARSSGGGLIISQPRSEVKTLIGILNLSHELVIADSISNAFKIFEEPGFLDNANLPAEVSGQSFNPPGSGLSSDFSTDEGAIPFDQPLVVECEECRAFVRVHSSGRFMCPSCHAEFTAEKDGTVIF